MCVQNRLLDSLLGAKVRVTKTKYATMLRTRHVRVKSLIGLWIRVKETLSAVDASIQGRWEALRITPMFETVLSNVMNQVLGKEVIPTSAVEAYEIYQ